MSTEDGKRTTMKAFLVSNSGFPQYLLLKREDAELCAESEFGDSPEVEIREVEVHCAGDPAQPEA